MSEEQIGLMILARFCRWADVGRTRAYEEIGAGRLRIRKLGQKTLVRLDDAREWRDNLPSGNTAKVKH